MEIFIATSIKSFPPTQARYQGSASTPAQLNKSNAAKATRREGARSATNEVGDELQKSASSEQDKLAGGKQYVARAESSCEFLCARGQETTSAEKCFMKQPQRLGDDFKFASS